MLIQQKAHILICLIGQFYVPAVSQIFQDLGGKWSVQNSEHELNLSAIVPGGIYSDLMRNNIIEDVFSEFNDIKSRWVSKTNWNYSKTFSVDPGLSEKDNINLVFDGIDTFSKILINDVIVGSTENMFVRYIFDVKPYLQRNNSNKIEIQFQSPVNQAQFLFEQQSKHYVVPPICIPSSLHGECHVNHIRKMQSSFAWDWGPALPSVGIWKKVYLEGYNSTAIRDVTVGIFSNAVNDHWDIQVKTYYANNSQSKIFGTIKIKLETHIATITNIYKINLNVTKDTVSSHNFSIPQSYVRLWWPNGYGNANLYDLEVSFLNLDKTERCFKKMKIGFRTVELVQNPIENGRTFYFKINNVPIFAKGANSIPINTLPELGQNKSTVRFLLQSAKDVNMNMLRVWGGGVYESDFYYELADQFGLLIWQDFMFACSMYPANDQFLETVKEEVRHQVRRLQYHPSIIIWAGNNENEAALRQNWYQTEQNFTLYKEDYKTLYVKTIKTEVLLNDVTRPYLTSSPTNGIETIEEDYVAKNPQSNYYGDVHFYNYIVDGWTTSTYPISRFASEFGYQSMPSMVTLLSATSNASDLIFGSPFLFNRQHHVMGYSEMVLLIDYELKLPDATSSNFSKAFIYYSQIMQAMAVKVEVEYYRQWRSRVNDAGEGLTMGALYWQLNDVWAAPTWSSIEFGGRWKMLHYFAKHFFAPIIVTGNLTNDLLNIFVVSDQIEIIRNAQINVSFYTWNSFTPLHKHSSVIDIIPGLSQKVISDSIENIFHLHNFTTQNCFIYLTLSDANNNSIASDNFVFPVSLKWSDLQVPTLQISKVSATKMDNEFQIEIETDAISTFVWLEAHDVAGRFSDNGFLQIKPIKVISFLSEEPTTVDKLRKSLTITNLKDKQYL